MNRRSRYLVLVLAGLSVSAMLSGCVLDWSPDGKQIVFVWGETGSGRDAMENTRLATINADGSGFHFLQETEKGFFPSWSPDGRGIVFALQTGGGNMLFAGSGNYRARMHDLGTRKSVNLAESPGPPFAWRADNLIGLHESGRGKEATNELITYDYRKGAVASRVKTPTRALSPAVQRLGFLPPDTLFYTEQNGMIRFLGNRIPSVLGAPGAVLGASVVAGNRLTWVEQDGTRGLTMYAFDPATGKTERTELPKVKTTNRITPMLVALSPSGDNVALVAMLSDSTLLDISAKVDIAVFSIPVGRGEARLLRKMPVPNVREPTAMYFPRWSPEGKRLAVLWMSTSGNNNAGLAVYDADGQNEKVLRSATIKQ